MKVFVHFEDTDDESLKKTLKLTLPDSWNSSELSRVAILFTDSYNLKFPSNQLSASNLHFQDNSGSKFYSNDKIGRCFEDRNDYYLFRGEYVGETVTPTPSIIPKLRCTNGGCNKDYTEEENSAESCCYHAGIATFHDCKKSWSCCPDRKAYDWDDFMKIVGCQIGPHCNEKKKPLFAPSPTVQAAQKSINSSSVRSISDFNSNNPNSVSSISSALKMRQDSSLVCTRRPDGTAKCVNKGCGLDFVVSENSSSSCHYHAGDAVFHDTLKYWSCCQEQKCYDFEDFLQVPGCVTGAHEDNFRG